MDEPFFIPESAMAIAAHPDDIEFSCAGTLARWARAGTDVTYLLCTSGDVGIAEPGMTKDRATEIREAEAREAARIVGAKNIVFLREPDGLLQATLEVRKKIVREIRRYHPEVVICSDPTVMWSDDYINHPDHRAAGLAALDAIFPAAGQPNLFEELGEEGLKVHKVRKVYVMGRYQKEMYVNISDTIEIKVAALGAHDSQVGHWDYAKHVREWAAKIGQGKEMRYAEAFRVITLIDDETWKKMKAG